MRQDSGAILDTGARARAVPVAGDEEPQFLHAHLCQVGLPRREPEGRVFERTNGNASMLLEAGHWFDGVEWLPQPLPFGTRPRLVLINLCSDAVRTRSPVIDVGASTREFLRRLGLDQGGRTMNAFRKQMIALSCCSMQLAYRSETAVTQIATRPVERFSAWLASDGSRRGHWPGELQLSERFYESLLEHAVPLDADALSSLQNSALALDVYSWLAHRLRRVAAPSGITISWAALREQFGQEFREHRDFRKTFIEALTKATGVYRDARIDVVAGGLHLWPSPPPCRRSAVVVPMLPAKAAQLPAAAAPHPALPAPPSADSCATADATVPSEALSAETIAALARLAPGTAPGELLATYERLFPVPAADREEKFLRWARAFLRGRPDDSAAAEPAPVHVDIVLKEATLEAAAELAPGWDIERLAQVFREWNADKGNVPRKPDQAFLAWIKAYTKGRRG